MIKKNWKEYFQSLRIFIFFAGFVFIFAAVFGFFLAKTSPGDSQELFLGLRKILEPILAASPFYQFLFIFLKNFFTIFIVIFFGIVFGVFPFLALYVNGHLLGTIFFLFQKEASFLVFLKSIIPHGIIEIPVLILAAAIGLDLGREAIQKIVLKKESKIKKKFSLALEIFFKVLIPLLILAAFVEVFLVPKILGIN